MIGLLMLLGLVVKTSYFAGRFCQQTARRGPGETFSSGTRRAARLRPISYYIPDGDCRNIPAALGLGDGAELRRGLATAVIGGMITSTLLTLVLVPAAYKSLTQPYTNCPPAAACQPAANRTGSP